MSSILQKSCECGAKHTHGTPIWCDLCHTFTHTVYQPRHDTKAPHAERVTEAGARAEAEVASEQGDEG